MGQRCDHQSHAPRQQASAIDRVLPPLTERGYRVIDRSSDKQIECAFGSGPRTIENCDRLSSRTA
jgi:hypothetical protein